MNIPEILIDSSEFPEEGGSDELKAILGSMTEGLIVLDMQGRILRVNPALLRTYGLENIADAPRTIEQLCALFECAEGYRIPPPVERSMRGEAVVDYETSFRRRDTGEVWMASENAAPIRKRSGEIVGVVLTIKDVTARKRAERDLRESESRYRELAESIPEIIFSNLPDGKCDYVNQYWYNYTGATPKGTLGYRWRSWLHPADLEKVDAILRTAPAKAGFQSEVRIRARDGRYRWFQTRGGPLKDPEGRVVRWLGICTDIDDQKKHELALRRTQKLESIGALAGGIAHDFNNLLTTIIGNASLLLAEAPIAERAALQDIIRAGESGAGLTKQLLEYAGKGKWEPQKLNLSELVAEMSEVLRLTIPNSIDLHIVPAPNLPDVMADSGQIQQLVVNLAVNAAEAIGEGERGSIEVATGATQLEEPVTGFLGERVSPGLFAWLEVSDTGSGIAEEFQTKIFDPFCTTKFLGRGLGLAVVQGIAHSHHAWLDLESSPGRGSRFRIHFPALELAAPVAPAAPCEHTGAKAILIVDDDEMTRRMMETALRNSGYSLYSAADGWSALQIFDAHSDEICLVVLDLLMPVMSGSELLPLLKERNPDIKVLLTSGYDENRARQSIRELGSAAFLQKPYTVGKLLDAIRALLA